jgi:acetate kinase
MRDILKAKAEGSEQAEMAYEIYAYRIKKYIGAYTAVLNGLDAIVFTAGVGENDTTVRHLACNQMDFLGIQLDEQKNKERSSGFRDISREDSPVRILVVPTNEELEIVKQCFSLLQKEAVRKGTS